MVLCSVTSGSQTLATGFTVQHATVVTVQRAGQPPMNSARHILPEWHVANFKVLHVVGDLHVIMHHTLACAAEGLDSVHLTLLECNNSAGQ